MNNKNIALIIGVGILAVLGGYWLGGKPAGTANNATDQEIKSLITRDEAYAVAQKSACVTEGLVKDDAFYNENSKTWWFTLEAQKAGCNPACVVFEETKTAEVNWRCTGLAPEPVSEIQEIIKRLFAAKYGDKAGDIVFKITKETAGHIRGDVRFASNTPSNIFLAAKVKGSWKLVHDGNSILNCGWKSYGFPASMVSESELQ